MRLRVTPFFSQESVSCSFCSPCPRRHIPRDLAGSGDDLGVPLFNATPKAQPREPSRSPWRRANQGALRKAKFADEAAEAGGELAQEIPRSVQKETKKAAGNTSPGPVAKARAEPSCQERSEEVNGERIKGGVLAPRIAAPGGGPGIFYSSDARSRHQGFSRFVGSLPH